MGLEQAVLASNPQNGKGYGRAHVFHILLSCFKVASFKLELRKCASRATLVLERCGFPARPPKVVFAYYSRAEKLRFRDELAKLHFAYSS